MCETALSNLQTTIRVIILSVFQSLIFIKFSNEIVNQKKVSQLNKIIGISVFILFNCVSYTYLYEFGYWIPHTLFVLSCMVYLYLYYLSNFIENIVMSLTYYITFWFTTYVTYYLFNTFNKYVPLPNVVLDYVATVVALVATYLLIVNVLPRFMNYKDHKITVNQFGLLLFFCLAGFISLMLYNNLFSIAMGAVCNIAILGFSLYISIIDEKNQKEKLLIERNKLLEEQDKLIRANEAEKYKSYQKSKEAEEKIRQINHDLNHHFNYILSCNDMTKIEEYIYQLKGTINQVSKYFDTGSSIIDLILQEQCEKAEKLDIKFAVMGGFEEELKIEPAIASVIFGNLLNNAVEGVSKVVDGYKKINITFYQEPHEEFFLEVSNTAEGKNLNIKDGKIETTKKDKDSHGIGLKSVKQVVESCGGTIEIKPEEDLFTVTVHIPIK